MATIKISEIKKNFDNECVIIGDIIENDSLSIGDLVSISNNDTTINVEIIAIHTFDNYENEEIALVISSDNFEKIKNLKLNGLEFNILKPMRDVDLKLAVNYGFGMKWWTGLLLITIVALIILIMKLINFF